MFVFAIIQRLKSGYAECAAKYKTTVKVDGAIVLFISLTAVERYALYSPT